MEKTHTPRSWHIGKRAGAEHGAIYGPNGEEIALPLGFFMEPDEAKANALLIAAAPELLFAARHVLRILESPKPNKPGGVSRAILREAIAKATGEAVQ